MRGDVRRHDLGEVVLKGISKPNFNVSLGTRENEIVSLGGPPIDSLASDAVGFVPYKVFSGLVFISVY